MIRRPPRSTLSSSSAASDVYKRQDLDADAIGTRAYGFGRLALDQPAPEHLLVVGGLAPSVVLRCSELLTPPLGAGPAARVVDVVVGQRRPARRCRRQLRVDQRPQPTGWSGADTPGVVPRLQRCSGPLQLVKGAERVDEPVVVTAVEVLAGQLQPQVAGVGPRPVPEAGRVSWRSRVSGVVENRSAEFRVVRP